MFRRQACIPARIWLFSFQFSIFDFQVFVFLFRRRVDCVMRLGQTIFTVSKMVLSDCSARLPTRSAIGSYTNVAGACDGDGLHNCLHFWPQVIRQDKFAQGFLNVCSYLSFLEKCDMRSVFIRAIGLCAACTPACSLRRRAGSKPQSLSPRGVSMLQEIHKVS